MEKRYLVLNGDIIGSRELNEDGRKDSMMKLNQACNLLNSKYSGALSGDFYISGRDSIQGVIRNVEKLLEILNDVEKEMLPYKLRYGIGYGNIDTYGTTMTAEMEGEAFDYATDGIVRTRANQNRIIFLSGNTKFDSEINEILKNIREVRESLSEDEFKRYLEYDPDSEQIEGNGKNKIFKEVKESEKILVTALKKM